MVMDEVASDEVKQAGNTEITCFGGPGKIFGFYSRWNEMMLEDFKPGGNMI